MPNVIIFFNSNMIVNDRFSSIFSVGPQKSNEETLEESGFELNRIPTDIDLQIFQLNNVLYDSFQERRTFKLNILPTSTIRIVGAVRHEKGRRLIGYWAPSIHRMWHLKVNDTQLPQKGYISLNMCWSNLELYNEYYKILIKFSQKEREGTFGLNLHPDLPDPG